MGDDEAFDSFYGKLNEVIITKLNLEKKIEDSKVVRKILRSLSESFSTKVIAIEESKDLDEIKIEELIGSCKVVIYKYVFCWLLFHAKFDCNFIQFFVPCIYCGNLL